MDKLSLLNWSWVNWFSNYVFVWIYRLSYVLCIRFVVACFSFLLFNLKTLKWTAYVNLFAVFINNSIWGFGWNLRYSLAILVTPQLTCWRIIARQLRTPSMRLGIIEKQIRTCFKFISKWTSFMIVQPLLRIYSCTVLADIWIFTLGANVILLVVFLFMLNTYMIFHAH